MGLASYEKRAPFSFPCAAAILDFFATKGSKEGQRRWNLVGRL